MADDMTIDLRINPAELAKTLRNLQDAGKAVGLTVQHLVWELAADAAKDAVKFTPPRGETVGSFREQRQIGENAIAIDLDRLFADSSNPDYVFFMSNGRRYGRRTSGRTVFEIQNDHWNIQAEGVEAIHLLHRNEKGRVPRQAHQYWGKSRTTKKGKIISIQAAYHKTLKKRVGELKAGWMKGVEMFCTLAKKKPGIPKWITRHTSEGTSEDHMTADGDGYIKIENTAHHRDAIRQDIFYIIQKKRQSDVDKWLPKRMERIAEKHNAGDATPEAVTA